MKLELDALPEFLVQQSWQITIVVGLGFVACLILRNASAHLRYLLWLVVMAKCLMPPMISLPVPVLPVEEHTIPLTSAANFASSNHIAKHDASSEESTHLRKPSTLQPEFAVKQPVAESTVTREPSPSPLPLLDLRKGLVIGWLLIVGILLIGITVRMCWISRRLRHTTQMADDSIQTEVVALAETLGMKRSPPVYMADVIAQPFVYGWLRGDIYLPLSFSSMGTVEQRRAILTHELAHILRWDVAVNHLQNFVQALFFFHPLIWFTNQKIRQEREKCCDEIVLSTSGVQRKIYCEAIVAMLAQEYASRQSTPLLSVTGSIKNVKERISTMLSPSRKFRRNPSRSAFITILLVAACVLPTTVVMKPQISNAVAQDTPTVSDRETAPEGLKSDNDDTWATGQTMDVRVINADSKEPIPDVKLILRNEGPGLDFQDVKTQKTDADGWSRLTLPDLPPKEIRVYPVKKGFVTLRVLWTDTPHPTMPKSITIPMQPGKNFGGIVQNEAGEPISDVKVTVDYLGNGNGENPDVCASINTSTTTDKDGRWQVDVMPAEIDNEQWLYIYLNHPRYDSDHLPRRSSPTSATERPPLKQLFDQSAVMVMRDRWAIDGKVVDQNGTPIPNATINDRLHYLKDSNRPRATSNENGEFRITEFEYSSDENDFRASNPDHLGVILTVQAVGYAPELVFVDPNSSPLEIKLRAGASVHGLLVDESGQPVEEAWVGVETWRGRRGRLELNTKTDVEGRFHLTDLPTDNVRFSIGKEGYMRISDFPMTPSNDEYKVTLKAPVRIIGSVTDAETGKPLEKFSLVPGMDFEDGRNPFWLRHDTKPMVRQGRYETTLTQDEFSWRLRIEADGYMPAESRIFRPHNPDRGEITYDFQLVKSPPMTGTVLGLDSKPLAGADVYLATQQMQIEERKVSYTDHLPVKTDANGQFQFPPEVEPFCLVVVHQQGIAMITEAECKTPPRITIEPWTAAMDDFFDIHRKPAHGQSSDFPIQRP